MGKQLKERYAKVVWSPEDIQSINPDMTYDEAEEWLQNNAKHIQSRLIELGHQVIEDLMN